ncbi:hypothetical protein [Flavobacterium orientale]|nr:hypothetical protein [Flavobacterium orientale]
MTRTTFTLLFMVLAFVFLYAMAHFEKLDVVAAFSFILVLVSYTAGQYSTKFPKEKEKSNNPKI